MPEENVRFLHNPSFGECEEVYSDADSGKILGREGKKTLVIHVFSGEGVQSDGSQAILVNEYDEKTRYYKQFPAEKRVKTLAANY